MDFNSIRKLVCEQYYYLGTWTIQQAMLHDKWNALHPSLLLSSWSTRLDLYIMEGRWNIYKHAVCVCALFLFVMHWSYLDGGHGPLDDLEWRSCTPRSLTLSTNQWEGSGSCHFMGPSNLGKIIKKKKRKFGVGNLFYFTSDDFFFQPGMNKSSIFFKSNVQFEPQFAQFALIWHSYIYPYNVSLNRHPWDIRMVASP